MWAVVSTNMTGLGGQMGTERTWVNWRENYYHLDNAKERCEQEYIDYLTRSAAKHLQGQGMSEQAALTVAQVSAQERFTENFRWIFSSGHVYQTPDLIFVQYSIAPIVFQDEAD